jgi:hypothetical protein
MDSNTNLVSGDESHMSVLKRYTLCSMDSNANPASAQSIQTQT